MLLFGTAKLQALIDAVNTDIKQTLEKIKDVDQKLEESLEQPDGEASEKHRTFLRGLHISHIQERDNLRKKDLFLREELCLRLRLPDWDAGSSFRLTQKCVIFGRERPMHCLNLYFLQAITCKPNI
jgi:hypothetical protein